MKLQVPYQLGVLAMIGLAGLGGCSKSKAPEDNASSVTWQKVTITAGRSKHVVEVARFAHPIPVKIVETAGLGRDTPLDTWNSWQSLSVSGKDDKDLKAYADFYVNPQAFLSRLKSTPAQFFDDARKADERPQAVGMVKTGKYQAVVYSVKRSSSYRAAVMVTSGGKFVIDDDAKLKDPVLRELAGDGYQIVKERPATAPSK